MKSFRAYSLILALFAVMVFCGSASAYTLSFNPSSATGNVGDAISVDVNLSLGTQLFREGSFDINFDPSILQLTGTVFGPALDFTKGWFPSSSDPAVTPPLTLVIMNFGYLDGNNDPAMDLLTGDVLLATITFNAFGPGVSELSFANINMYVFDVTGAPADGDSESGSVTVNRSKVPEPSSLLLLGLGIAGLVAGRKRIGLK